MNELIVKAVLALASLAELIFMIFVLYLLFKVNLEIESCESKNNECEISIQVKQK